MMQPETTSAIATLYQSISPRYPELKGQTALVTGAAQGIGLGIAVRLAREGMQVWLADINATALAEAAAALRGVGAVAWDFAGDMSQQEAIHRLFDAVKDQTAALHLLVNNAADLRRRRLFDEEPHLLEDQLATNIRGPYWCSKYAAAVMRENSGGNIIHISSVGGLRAHWHGLPYDVTKGAIDAMTRAMAIDLAEYNIRVNAVAPGATRTEKTAAMNNVEIQQVAELIPLRRFATTSEMSAVVAFLASSEASYITGQVIYVDGGITAQLSPPGQNL
jgi:NAD(P)-dependent dehydrogenase (short-subunit alcohol dehydrogenase family)